MARFKSMNLLGTLVMALAATPSLSGEPRLAIVTSATAPPTITGNRLDLRALRRIYRRQQLLWRNGERILPLNLPASSPLRSAFTQSLFKRSVTEMATYWNEAYFDGKRPPHVVDSQEAVLRFVTRYPGAIGYIATCRTDARVKVLMTLKPPKPLPDTVCND